MSYGESGSSGPQISQQVLVRALNRLGNLLEEQRKRLELVCCGGAPAVEEKFSAISPEYRSFFKDESAAPAFAERNIFAPKEFMFVL